MSWSGTVRCSWCGKSGHNAAGCEEKLEQMEKWRDSLDFAERSRAYNYFSKRERKAERAKNRKCSYCGEVGHTRRTCPVHKKDAAVFSDMIYEAREKLYSRFLEKGFGPGALVQMTVNSWDGDKYVDHEMVGIVTKIDYDKLSHRTHADRGHVFVPKDCNLELMNVTVFNHPRNGIHYGTCPLPLSVLDIKENYTEDDPNNTDWWVQDAARVKLIAPTTESIGLKIPNRDSCYKLASSKMKDSGKRRHEIPNELREVLRDKGLY